MTKYYNKKIPTEIHFIYGGRKSGRTYYEVKKLKNENQQLYNTINEVIDDLKETIEINKHIKIKNNELVQLDIDHIKHLIDKLKGSEE